MKKNLLIAGYSGYKDFSLVRDFVESFSAVRNPETDDLCIVYDEQSDINYQLDEYKWVIQLRKNRLTENAYADRFKWFADVIDDSNHTRFITADIRDVVFQSNPFDWMKENLKNSMVVSDEGVPHDSRGGNFTWNQVKDGFPDYTHSLAKKNVINVGVMGGDKRVGRICQRVFDMCKEVEPKIHTNNSYAFDQGAMGVLCHLTEERAFTHHSDGRETWCLTMSVMADSLPEVWVLNQKLCNPEGQPYAIVHQYDRFDVLEYKGHGRFSIVKDGKTYDDKVKIELNGV